MDADQIGKSGRTKTGPGDATGRPARPWLPLRAVDVPLYRLCDRLSGLLIFPMLIFSPWAFGTTQPWAIWSMNGAGYALGGLLLVKWFIRHGKGYPAMRWDQRCSRFARRLGVTLAALTVLFLLYCLTAAWNAAAIYHPQTQLFDYRDYLRWLPHSFDRDRSWFAFAMCLGLACSFWAVVDWVLGMTDAEARLVRQADANADAYPRGLPARLRWLLWLLCLNGTLLGMESIAQRASGSDKLLFLVKPRVNQWGETQFGPYSYRSNAAQYFNLLWPLCLGFWSTWQHRGGLRSGLHHLLLAGAAIMAACPIISTSRGGAMISAGLLSLAVGYLLFLHLRFPSGRRPWLAPVLLGGFLAGALVLGAYFGWDLLAKRLENLPAGYEGREAMFNDARPMADDYPVYGTGPGTFATVFQLYRISNATYWPEQLHNDWLETRITYGWAGFLMLMGALGCVGLRRWARGGIHGSRRLGVLMWLALAGCLIHGIYDFPFQVHSIVFLFLTICALLFSFSGRPWGSGGR